MKIRPRKFADGGNTLNLDDWINSNQSYYDWYKTIYPNALVLAGSPLKLRNDNWNRSQLSSSHYTTDDLRRSAYNNYLYTNDYNARQEDLTHWGESLSDFATISDQDFVNRYNKQAQTIRDAREAPQTYNRTGYTGTNRTFRNMFWNRSRQGTNTPLYTIGYLDNIEDIEGTSTWQRRMDRYLKPFGEDTPEGLKNRIFYITRPDGTKIKVYKKLNGDIGLFNDPKDPENPTSDPSENPNTPENNPADPTKPGGSITGAHSEDGYRFNLKNLNLNKYAPTILGGLRLAGALASNRAIFNETMKGIKPALLQTYKTHRQVVGDEGTKLAYYTRAAQGLTKAAQPVTSDMDRQMAYQMEAKRVGDELRAQGDLADNLEIRRTSDESNLHQWANILRATEVANANMLELNKTNKLRADLRAGLKSANFTSIDNALRELQYKTELRLKEDEVISDQIFALDEQYKLQNDETYLGLYNDAMKIYQDLEKKGKSIQEIKLDPEFKAAKQKLDVYLYQRKREQLENLRTRRNGTIGFGKSGLKFTFKSKDDLLYKASRDAVDHYRKMVKMTNDATVKTLTKPVKLTSHPKKMQLGGVAPFVVYTPIALGGERSVSSSTGSETAKGSSSTAKSKETGPLDIIKDLFKGVDGLPSDVNGVYSAMSNFLAKQSLFGGELSTDDLSTMYLQLLQQITNIKFSKAAYDDAKKLAESNKALNEFAVTSDGKLVVQNTSSGELKQMSSSELFNKLKNGEALNPLTNNDLLSMRAYSLSFNNGLLDIVSNGVGIEKIGEFIKSQLPKMESTEETIEGYTKLDSKNIKEGLKLLAEAPPGDYKYTIKDKSNLKLAELALQYLQHILPTNMKTVLQTHALLEGTSMNAMLANLVSSNVNTSHSVGFDAVTGKATKDANGNSKSTEGDIKSNFLVLVLKDLIGVPRKFSMITRDGNSELYSLNSKYISQLPNVNEDMSVDRMLTESKVGSILDSSLGITFGDLIISPENLRDIMFDKSGGATVVTLPCRWENGHKVVNFEIKDKFDEAVKEAGKIVPVNYQDPKFTEILSLKLKEKNLNSLVVGDLLDPDMFGHFMVVSAYTTDKVKLNNFNSKYIEKVNNPDKSLENRLIKGLSTNKDKNDYKVDVDDTWGWFEGTWDDVYRGSVFIPLNNDPISAQTGWGNDSIKLDEAQELATQYQTWNKMGKVKSTDSSLL